LEIEKLGKPAIPLMSPVLVEAGKDNAYELGWPHPRLVAVSEPNALRGEKAIHRILNGQDPVSGQPLMTALVNALTQKLTAEEKQTGKLTHPVEPRILPFTGTFDEVQEYFLKNRMTDGLPVVIPTEDKVKEMLKGTGHSPEEIVSPAFKMANTDNGQREGQNITVEKVAVIGVMAGGRPVY